MRIHQQLVSYDSPSTAVDAAPVDTAVAIAKKANEKLQREMEFDKSMNKLKDDASAAASLKKRFDDIEREADRAEHRAATAASTAAAEARSASDRAASAATARPYGKNANNIKS